MFACSGIGSPSGKQPGGPNHLANSASAAHAALEAQPQPGDRSRVYLGLIIVIAAACFSVVLIGAAIWLAVATNAL